LLTGGASVEIEANHQAIQNLRYGTGSHAICIVPMLGKSWLNKLPWKTLTDQQNELVEAVGSDGRMLE
jgi:hypothetical protein